MYFLSDNPSSSGRYMIHTAKIMKYTKRRTPDKKFFMVTYTLRDTGKLSKNFSLEQCLFGTHLLSRKKYIPIGAVEAKNDLRTITFYPGYAMVGNRRSACYF